MEAGVIFSSLIFFTKSAVFFFLFLFLCVFVGCFIIRKKFLKPRKIRNVQNGKYKNVSHIDENDFDVIIVGAGPAGGCCAYYAAKNGLRVCLLERKKFPRDKFCGNACTVPALRIIKEMGIMPEFIDNDEVVFPDSGGFVTPSGLSYIGKSVIEVGEPLAGAIKRINLDMRIAKNAAKNGACLKEECDVVNAKFNKEEEMWEILCEEEAGEKQMTRKYKGRVLVCADGSQSTLARKLGYVTEAPKGVSTRAYVKSGTHNAKLDGICVYPPFSLPGYCAVFKHPKDELNFCYYLIPCGGGDNLGSVKESDLPSLHKYALENDPFISRIMGPNAVIEPMRVAPLRVGCQGVKTTYDDHFLIVGDAAGFVDPITGEGIHNAMMSGKHAALTLIDMHKNGDYSKLSTAQYEDRWMIDFGYDFKLSEAAARLLWKFPFILDACCEEMHRGGDVVFSNWAKVMTMMEGKEKFLEVQTAFPLFISIIKFCFKKYFLSLFSNRFAYNYGGSWKRTSSEYEKDDE